MKEYIDDDVNKFNRLDFILLVESFLSNLRKLFDL